MHRCERRRGKDHASTKIIQACLCNGKPWSLQLNHAVFPRATFCVNKDISPRALDGVSAKSLKCYPWTNNAAIKTTTTMEQLLVSSKSQLIRRLQDSKTGWLVSSLSESSCYLFRGWQLWACYIDIWHTNFSSSSTNGHQEYNELRSQLTFYSLWNFCFFKTCDLKKKKLRKAGNNCQSQRRMWKWKKVWIDLECKKQLKSKHVILEL